MGINLRVTCGDNRLAVEGDDKTEHTRTHAHTHTHTHTHNRLGVCCEVCVIGYYDSIFLNN